MDQRAQETACGGRTTVLGNLPGGGIYIGRMTRIVPCDAREDDDGRLPRGRTAGRRPAVRLRVRNLKRKQVCWTKTRGATAAHAAHNCRDPGSSPGGPTRKTDGRSAQVCAPRGSVFRIAGWRYIFIYARARAFAELVKREGLEPRREKA